jgi:hypothetical protein
MLITFRKPDCLSLLCLLYKITFLSVTELKGTLGLWRKETVKEAFLGTLLPTCSIHGKGGNGRGRIKDQKMAGWWRGGGEEEVLY